MVVSKILCFLVYFESSLGRILFTLLETTSKWAEDVFKGNPPKISAKSTIWSFFAIRTINSGWISQPYWEIPINGGRPEWEDHMYTIPCEGVLTSPWESFCTSMTSPRHWTTDHWLLLLGLRNIWCRSVWRWSLLFVPWKNGNSSKLGGATPAKDRLQSFANHRKIHISWGCPSSRWMRLPESGVASNKLVYDTVDLEHDASTSLPWL